MSGGSLASPTISGIRSQRHVGPKIGQTTSGRSNDINADLDSHADTSCFSREYCVILADSPFAKEASVTGFLDSMKVPKKIPILSVLTAYDDPVSGCTYILVFHQVLVFNDLSHHLICPNQLRQNGVLVRSCPKSLDPDRTDTSHSIQALSEDGQVVTIHLHVDGVASTFVLRKPSQDEIENCHRVEMTSNTIEWDPSGTWLEEMEEDCLVTIDRTIKSVREPSYTDTQYRNGAHSTGTDLIDSDTVLYERVISKVMVQTARSSSRGGKITPEELSKRWYIGLKRAKQTLAMTTQKCVRDYTNVMLARRFKPLAYQLRHRAIRSTWYCDIMKFPRETWFRKNKYALVFADEHGYIKAYPLRQRKESPDALKLFHQQVGIPAVLRMDNGCELAKGDFARNVRRSGSRLWPIEPHTPKLNPAEVAIRQLKVLARLLSIREQSPQVLSDHLIELCASIRSSTASNHALSDGRTPRMMTTGDDDDISHLCEFHWFQWCWFYTPSKGDTVKKHIGRWLGPAETVGEILCAKILQSNMQVMHRTTYMPLSEEDLRNPEVTELRKKFDAVVTERLDNTEFVPGIEEATELSIQETTPRFDPYKDELDATQNEMRVSDDDDLDQEALDQYLQLEVFLPNGDQKQLGKVLRRVTDQNGVPIGKRNDIPMLHTGLYEVEFPDGTIREYSANLIAENLYEQIDDDGHYHSTVKAIIDHKMTDEAITMKDIELASGKGVSRIKPTRTTKGWLFLIEWQDGTYSWERLADVKNTIPVECAEYVHLHGLTQQPAFSWWVPYTLKKRDRIIKKLKARSIARKTHKFGIRVPSDVREALQIDDDTQTDYWAKAIQKEMKNVRVAFKVLEDDEHVPPTYRPIECHMIFDVKMDHTRKARLVAGGHKTADPDPNLVYASVVSRDSVRIAFLLAGLNNLDICAADIQNAFLESPCSEKFYTTLGREFGSDQGKKALVVRALYGLKSAAASFGRYLKESLRNLGWIPTKGDPNVYLRPATKSDGTKIYEYLLTYVDDLLCIGINPKESIEAIGKVFTLKPGSVGPPTQYLGAEIGQYSFESSNEKHWYMGSEKYVKESIRNVQLWLKDRGLELKKGARSVLPTDYRPELDVSEELDTESASYYMSQISVLRWIVELGRIDIAAEVSMLSSYMVSPRKGHLTALLHIYAWLMAHSRSKIVFDTDRKNIPRPKHDESDWKVQVDVGPEEIPTDVPEARGEAVQIIVFVDANHAGDQKTRRSRTGLIIFLNSAPIIWMSKKQGSIETSSFGSEFAAMKVATEQVVALRWKLRTFGVPIDGPAHVRCDNQSVVLNSSVPTSRLNKKNNAVAFHYVREKAAQSVISVHKEGTKTNIADMLSKIQTGSERIRLAQMILY